MLPLSTGMGPLGGMMRDKRLCAGSKRYIFPLLSAPSSPALPYFLPRLLFGHVLILPSLVNALK